MRVYLGIDPGLDGALAWIAGDDVTVEDTPATTTKPREYLAASMAALLEQVRLEADGGELFAVLERAQPTRIRGTGRQPGASSTFSTGRGFGLWEGLLAGQRIPYMLVQPQVWRRALGFPAGAGKDYSRAHAGRLFPTMADQLKRVKDHGRAEALLIAEYARRTVAGA